MCVMLDLIEIARIQHQEADDPSDPFVQRLGLERRIVAKFVLSGVEKVQQRAVYDEYRNGPPRSPRQR